MTAVPKIVREAVEWRSRSVCEVCGTTQAVHMHHRKLRSQGGRNVEDNLLHVCLACHDRIHQFPAISYRRGWLVKSWDEAS